MSALQRTRATEQRHGVATIGTIVMLIVLNLIVVRLVLGTGRGQDLSLRRLETVRAFYAAEAGTNMAMREMMLFSDEDGDSVVGTISDDANTANDPTISGAQFVVTQTVVGSQTTIASEGRSGLARRKIEAVSSE